MIHSHSVKEIGLLYMKDFFASGTVCGVEIDAEDYYRKKHLFWPEILYLKVPQVHD